MRLRPQIPCSDRVIILGLALISCAAALVSEFGRIVIKGQDYAYSSLNDIHYYTAMVFNLWESPIAVGEEVTRLGFKLSPQELSTFYGGDNHFWQAIVHSENGLSHQPPWAYRILIPTAAAGLRTFGISVNSAFLILYVFSAVLLTVSVYLLLRPYTRRASWAVAVALSALISALAATSPGYPDMTFLGFAMLAVFFAYGQNGPGFALAGFLAGMTRETALILIPSWLLLCWAHKRLSWHSATFVLGPILGVLGARFITDVPNSAIEYAAMIQSLEQWPKILFFALIPVLVIGLMSPRIMRIRIQTENRIRASEAVIWVIGVLFVLASAITGLASSRMALLSLPLFLAPVGWLGATSRMWLAAAMTAGIGYAASDTLAFRADPIFGNIPWFVSAFLVLSMQALALIRDCYVLPVAENLAGVNLLERWRSSDKRNTRNQEE